jgi:hypothetical protein
MRNRVRIMVAVLFLGGCHPRYAPLEGSGGSAGLTTFRARILLLIASGDYAHAQEYLEAADWLTEQESARFEQMISAAQRHLVPFLESALTHVFRDKLGHFAMDTAEARELIQTTAIEDHFVGLKESGTRVYQQVLETGAQIWVYVYDGTIRDAGQNETPRSIEHLLK